MLWWNRLGREDRGANLVEYSLLILLIAILALLAVQATGLKASSMWNTISTSV